MRSTLLCAVVIAACAKRPELPATGATAQVAAEDSVQVAIREADDAWDERVDPARLSFALTRYEQVAAARPDDRHVLERLARGWYFHGDAHAPDDATRIERWAKAIAWGQRCLALNEEYAAAIAAGTREQDAVFSATIEDAPCLYWTSTALGKWAKAQSLSKTLRHLPTVKAYVARLEALQPDFFHHGPARYWGAYYAALPGFAGRDLEKSATFFESSIAGAPDYLATRVLRAEYLAVATQDLALFEQDLAFVLSATAPANASPDIAAENEIERRKATSLLAKKAELFHVRDGDRPSDAGSE